jgi:hypothetical protein
MKWPRGSVTGRITCRSSSHLDYGTNIGDYVDAFMQAPASKMADGLYEHHSRA